MYYSIELKKSGRTFYIKYVHIYENTVIGLELSERYLDAFIQVNTLELAAINTYLENNGFEPVYSFQGCINPDDPLTVPRQYGTINRLMCVEMHENRPEGVTVNVGIGMDLSNRNN